MRFDNFLIDGIVIGTSFVEEMEMFNIAIENIKHYKLWNSPIVWRGFNSSKRGTISFINNERMGYKGNLDDKVVSVISGLNLKYNPVFTTKDYNNARFFGNPCVFIPNDNFEAYVNSEINDIMSIKSSDKSSNEIVNEYNKYINEIPHTVEDTWQELIISCKSYYLVYPIQLMKFNKGKIKSPKEIKKYNDVVLLYNEYVSYIKQFVQKNLSNNPKLIGHYSKHYPKEWFVN